MSCQCSSLLLGMVYRSTTFSFLNSLELRPQGLLGILYYLERGSIACVHCGAVGPDDEFDSRNYTVGQTASIVDGGTVRTEPETHTNDEAP